MLQLDYKSGMPICDQIVNGFIRMKALGLVENNEQMPSVRSLAVELCVNPNTVQKAYQILESKGIIYSVKGKGSFISDDAAADLAVIKTIKKNFKNAAAKALELGMTETELMEAVAEVCRKGVDRS